MEKDINGTLRERILDPDIFSIISRLENKSIEIISICALGATGIDCDYKQFLGFDCANKSLGYTLTSINTNMAKQLNVIGENIWSLMEKEDAAAFSKYAEVTKNYLCAKTLAQKKQREAEFLAAADSFAATISKNANIINALVRYLYISYFLRVTYFIPVKCGVLDLIPGKKVKETNIMERTRSLKNELRKISVPASTIVLIEDQPTIINNKSTTIQDQICYEFSDHSIFMVPPKWKNRLCFGVGLSYEEIKTKYAKKYTANKVHSKLNFLKYIEIISEKKMIEGVAKENYDDLADSCMQIIAYLQFKDFT